MWSFLQCLCRFSPVSVHSPNTCTLAWLESVNQPLPRRCACGCVCTCEHTCLRVCVLWWTGGLSRLHSCLSTLCLSKNVKQQQIIGFSSFPPLMVETSWWSRQETLSMLADTHSFGLVCVNRCQIPFNALWIKALFKCCQLPLIQSQQCSRIVDKSGMNWRQPD